MSVLNKLFAFAIANQRLSAGLSSSTHFLRHFLANLATILTLLLIIAMMVGALIVGALYAGYLGLISNGFTVYQSLGILGGVIFVLLLFFGATLAIRLKRLRTLPTRVPPFQPPAVVSRLTNIGHAFVDGLLQRS